MGRYGGRWWNEMNRMGWVFHACVFPFFSIECLSGWFGVEGFGVEGRSFNAHARLYFTKKGAGVV